MDEIKHKMTLDQPLKYQITVPGLLNESWPEWVEDVTVTVENDDPDLPLTTLTGAFDQAALQGLLRRLYTLGLPLISVICVDCG